MLMRKGRPIRDALFSSREPIKIILILMRDSFLHQMHADKSAITVTVPIIHHIGKRVMPTKPRWQHGVSGAEMGQRQPGHPAVQLLDRGNGQHRHQQKLPDYQSVRKSSREEPREEERNQ